MSQVKIQGNASGTGVFTIAAPNSNTDRTILLPDEAGTILTTSTATITPKGIPAFAASANTTQAVSGATWTKVNFANEFFDTNSNFASSRFTPTVAGYYQLNAHVYYASSPGGQAILNLYRNGGPWSEFGRNVAAGAGTLAASNLVYSNGSTDYWEVYFYSTGANTINDGTSTVLVGFSGYLVRAA